MSEYGDLATYDKGNGFAGASERGCVAGHFPSRGEMATSAALDFEETPGRLAKDGREVAVANDGAELTNRKTLHQGQHDVERSTRVPHEGDNDRGFPHPIAVPADPSIDLLVQVPHRRERLGFVVRESPRLQHGDADELVRVPDQHPALFLASRISELDLLADVHRPDSLVDRADEERILFRVLDPGFACGVFPLCVEILTELFVLRELRFSGGLRRFGRARLLRAPSFRFATARLFLEELLGQLGEEPAALPGQSRILEERVDERRRAEEPRLVRDEGLLGPTRGSTGEVEKGLVVRRTRADDLLQNEGIVGLPRERVELVGLRCPGPNERGEPIGRGRLDGCVRGRGGFLVPAAKGRQDCAERVFGIERKEPARGADEDFPRRESAAQERDEIFGRGGT